MKKNIFLHCVYENNLGDDLFVYTIVNRYPYNKFMVINNNSYKKISQNNNLKVLNINHYIFRIFQIISNMLSKRNIIDSYLITRSDIIVTIGGSIFIDRKNQKENKKNLKWYRIKKKSYVIGANIGPIYNNSYIKQIKNIALPYITDMCVRDKKSYEYLRQYKKVRYAPDILFSLDLKQFDLIDKHQEKKVIISVIDINKKKNQIKNPNLDKYENLIIELIKYFYQKGYNIELMSFCKKEGDNDAIASIVKKINDNKIKRQIRQYNYLGDVKLAIRELSSATVIVGTRFHANILGLLMEKTVIPIIYNDKTRELLSDIDFKGKYIDIENIDNFSIEKLTEKDLNYKINIDKYRKEAEKHFEKLDKVLK